MSCPDCFKGSILEGTPTGSIEERFHGAYFAPAATTSTTGSKRAIVLLTDIFGLPLKNCKVIADEFARRLGCDVWVPDLFAGKPFLTPEALQQFPEKAGQKMGVLGGLKFAVTALGVLPSFIRNRPAVVDARVVSCVEAIQAEKKYEKLGAIGYCFGGGVAVRLGGSSTIFDSIIIAHPSPPSNADILSIKAPVAWVLAEEDFSLSPKRVAEIEALYVDRPDAVHQFITYKGTTHGFAARPNFKYPEVKEAFEKAFEDSVAWFEKTIPAQSI
ncbi:unnamed protein product [Mycena citricolor]|uniref:Dienelactone hydrolase domain-containing protein n=1 Tax=Mycena citricolor TaxID=2018698 RepID=A0AAD2H8A4_9AGAR|nr:unnamed protein product [Mycena citricolor]